MEATKLIASGECLGALAQGIQLLGCHLPRRKCFGSLALTEIEKTGLNIKINYEKSR